MIGSDWRLQAVNAAALDLLGRAQADHPPEYLWELLPLAPTSEVWPALCELLGTYGKSTMVEHIPTLGRRLAVHAVACGDVLALMIRVDAGGMAR